MRLADLRWPDVAARAPSSLLAVPVGSTEQHGPHLPLSTDTAIAVALAERLAGSRPDVLVAPAVAYGSSGEHASFAGTLSIGQEALEHVLIELGRSADAFRGMVFVSAHGGNAVPLDRAVSVLRAEGRHVHAWSPPYDEGTMDLHAGRTETSILLALSTTTVRLEAARAGDRRPLHELLPALRSGGVKSVSTSGVLGDPAGSSAEEGNALLDAFVADLLSSLEGW